VIYTARLPEAVYVLHAFQKKSQATWKRDIELARARLTELMKEAR
jgi:phage-related protein